MAAEKSMELEVPKIVGERMGLTEHEQVLEGIHQDPAPAEERGDVMAEMWQWRHKTNGATNCTFDH